MFAPKFMDNQMFDHDGNVLITSANERSYQNHEERKAHLYKTNDQVQRKSQPGGGPHAHISPMLNFKKKQEESSVK